MPESALRFKAHGDRNEIAQCFRQVELATKSQDTRVNTVGVAVRGTFVAPTIIEIDAFRPQARGFWPGAACHAFPPRRPMADIEATDDVRRERNSQMTIHEDLWASA